MAKGYVMSSKERIYLQAWESPESGDLSRVMFEITNHQRFVQEHARYAGVVRGNVTVTVYTCFWKDTAVIPKRVLQGIATCYLDGNYTTTVIDFRF